MPQYDDAYWNGLIAYAVLRLTSTWSTQLSKDENLLFIDIVGRTFSKRRAVDYIAESQFLEGVGNETELLIAPVPMNRSAFYSARKGLIDKGILVLLPRNKYGPGYKINLNWDKTEQDLGPELRDDEDENVINVPNIGQERPKYGTTTSEIRDVTIYNTDNKDYPRVHAPARGSTLESVTMSDPMENVKAALATANAKNRAARDKKKTKANASSYETIWQDAYIEANPEERWFPWTIAQKASFKQALERGVPTKDREAFITYVVYDWSAVINAHFSWMRDKPAYPVVQFVTRNITKFWQAFEDHRDPNRKLRQQINTAGPAKAVVAAPDENVIIGHGEAERLREENAKLKAQLTANDQAKRLAKRRTIKKLVLNRKPVDDNEFGKWRDD